VQRVKTREEIALEAAMLWAPRPEAEACKQEKIEPKDEVEEIVMHHVNSDSNSCGIEQAENNDLEQLLPSAEAKTTRRRSDKRG
jgi:hypothetical protein